MDLPHQLLQYQIDVDFQKSFFYDQHSLLIHLSCCILSPPVKIIFIYLNFDDPHLFESTRDIARYRARVEIS